MNLKSPSAVSECEKTGTCFDNADGSVSPKIDTRANGEAAGADLGPAFSDGPSDRVDSAIDRPIGSADGTWDAVVGECWTPKGPVAAGTVCRPALGPCDVPEVCDGVTPSCPPDKFALGDAVCREAKGGCDLAESCTGVGPECPADVLRSAGAICRPSAGLCDVAESCSGKSPDCPVDEMAPALTICRKSEDGEHCNPTETCTGAEADCPKEITYPKLAAPTSVAASAEGLQATITWAPVPGASGYNVLRSDTSKSGYTIQGSSPSVTEPPYVNKGLTGGATYYYVVTAINTITTCESDPSSEVKVTTTGTCLPPPAPTVTATPDNGKITLSWTASSGASSYLVARGTTAGTGYASIAEVTKGTSYSDLSVTNGTTYYYVVKASNGTCSSQDSAEVSSSPLCTPPPPPTNVLANPGDGSVTLAWTAPVGGVSYAILRSEVAGSGYTLVGTSKTTSYTDTTAKNGTTYYYVVTASNGTCSSVNSIEAPAAPACVPPSIPKNVSAKAGNTQIVLVWDPSTGGATSYEVSRGKAAGGPYDAPVATPSAGFTDTNLVNGTTYYYVVTASNGSCSSAASAQVSAVPICTPPSLPTGVKATPGDSKVSLSWTASTNGPTSYTVSRAEGTGAYAVLGTPATTSFTDSTAVNGHTYSYVISASNGKCSSDNTTAVTATPAPVCTQLPPTGVTATATSQKVTLNWTAADGAADYDIYRSPTSGSGFGAVGTVNAPTTTFVDTDTTLKIGSTYYYVVTANNATCSSPNSAEVSATVTCTPPAAPTGVAVSASPTDGSLTISWGTVADATGYTVSRSTSATGSYEDISTKQTAATYKDTGCASGTTCYYKVRSSNVGGACISSDSTVVSGAACKMPSGPPTGLAKTVGLPNPGSGKVLLTWTAPSNASSYDILRTTTSGSGYSSVGTSTSASFTDSSASNDTSYYYVVKALNGGPSCASDNSAEIKAIPRACRIFAGSTQNFQFDTTGAICFITCWDMAATSWGCSNFSRADRTITVNGRDIQSCGGDPGAKSDTYYYKFELGPGKNTYDAVNWFSNSSSIKPHDCP